MALPHGAAVWSTVCDCGLSSLTSCRKSRIYVLILDVPVNNRTFSFDLNVKWFENFGPDLGSNCLQMAEVAASKEILHVLAAT